MKPIARLARGSMPPHKLRTTSREWVAEAVRSRFPKLALALGDQAFEVMLARYFAREPDARVSVRESGARLAGFLQTCPEYPVWYAELAAIDRAHVEVLHAPATHTLARREITPDRILRLIPSHALVELTTATDELWRSLGEAQLVIPPRELDWPRTVLVWRTEGVTVHARTVQPDEGAALRAAARGTTLVELAAFFGGTSPHARALDVVVSWIDIGVIAR